MVNNHTYTVDMPWPNSNCTQLIASHQRLLTKPCSMLSRNGSMRFCYFWLYTWFWWENEQINHQIHTRAQKQYLIELFHDIHSYSKDFRIFSRYFSLLTFFVFANHIKCRVYQVFFYWIAHTRCVTLRHKFMQTNTMQMVCVVFCC